MKYKKGDTVFLGGRKVKIATQRGADAVNNKNKTAKNKDFKPISRVQRTARSVDRSEKFLENNLIGSGFRGNRKGLINLGSLDDLARM